MNKQASLLPQNALGKRKKVASLDKKKARAGWLFILPFLAIFVLVYLPIVIDSIWVSLCNIKTLPGGGMMTTFVAFENYSNALFTDTSFVKELLAGLKQLVIDIPAIVIFSLFMAVLLNQKMIGRAAFRAIFFIPVIISTGIVAYIDNQNSMLTHMVDSAEGIDTGSGVESASQSLSNVASLNWLFGDMKVGSGITDIVVGLIKNVYSIISRSGVQMLIFLAGLQSISPAIYESCKMEGASAWETFWKITFPMISPMILVNAIYTVIDSFTSQSNQVMKFIDGIYSQSKGMVRATAMSWVYFLVVIVILAIVAGLISAYVFYQRRD